VLDKGDGVLWIDTEGSFYAQRLIQIAKTRRDGAAVESRLFDKVHIWKIDDLCELSSRIAALTASAIKEMGVKCIIIDSIACLMRSSNSSRITAANSIQGVIRRLKLLADEAGLWIVVSNQMTTARVVEDDWVAGEDGEDRRRELYATTPALVFTRGLLCLGKHLASQC
jgi:RecA/RadA recombinase